MTGVENEHPAKRARTNSTENSRASSSRGFPSSDVPLSELVQDEEFWLEDGSVVLVAGGKAFRVYRALLASQSPVLANLLSPSNPDIREVLEGCSVVRLSDSPQDLAHLLRVLLPSKHRRIFPNSGSTQMSFHEVSAMIRLAHKYEIEDVLDQALSALKADLTSFDVAIASSPPMISALLSDRSDAISIVRLARLTNTPLLLPWALYICSHLGGGVLDGATREDGTVEYLDSADLKRCIDARLAFGLAPCALLSRVCRPVPSATCLTAENCVEGIQRILRTAVGSPLATGREVMRGWADYFALSHRQKAMCDACYEKLMRRDIEERRDEWRHLPDYFRIVVEGWAMGER